MLHYMKLFKEGRMPLTPGEIMQQMLPAMVSTTATNVVYVEHVYAVFTHPLHFVYTNCSRSRNLPRKCVSHHGEAADVCKVECTS